MDETTLSAIVNGAGGLVALYLALQVRAAITAIRRVVENHETRIEVLEDSRRYYKRARAKRKL